MRRSSTLVAVTGRAPHFLGVLGWALAMAGRTADARALLAELQTRPPDAPALVSEAWLLGALGQIDEAFDVLARAEAELTPPPLLQRFSCLRSAPRGSAFQGTAEETGTDFHHNHGRLKWRMGK